MNIAFVCNSLNGGGAERFTANISNCFSKDYSNNVYVITGKETIKDYKLESKVKRIDLLSKNLLKDLVLLLKVIKDNSIDVIVGIDIYPNFCVCLCSLFTKARCIISERNAPKQVNISKKSRILRWLLYRLANGYVFQTNGAKEFYSKKIQNKSVVIHNPIRENLPLKTKENKKEIVAVGRLGIQKNYPMLIKAFEIVHKKYPDYSLRIFGEGEEREQLENLVNELKLTGFVIFEGFTLNVHEAIKDSAIFVMTSDFEGMPNALMEAMAMGFPVVSTDCPSGGPRELIIDGENGFLCKVGDYAECAEKILLIIEDKKIKQSLQVKALTITASHNIDIIINQWKVFLTKWL